MKIVKRILQSFLNFLGALRFWRWRRKRSSFNGFVQIESSADPSADIASGKLVLIGPKEKPKWLRFACPCGCGEILALNLMQSHSPRWSVQIDKDGTMTAYPSVDAQRCASHFWIRHNKVEWV
jgi:hypothetical protein